MKKYSFSLGGFCLFFLIFVYLISFYSFFFLFRMLKQTQIDYREGYLKSDHWKEISGLARKHYGRVCFVCKLKGTDVHHITYRRYGRELLDDLRVLCRECHNKVHIDKKGNHTTNTYYIKNYLFQLAGSSIQEERFKKTGKVSKRKQRKDLRLRRQEKKLERLENKRIRIMSLPPDVYKSNSAVVSLKELNRLSK